jgi:hypothetical protein
MQQQPKTRMWWSGQRGVLTGAVAAALLLTGSALHLGAQPARADCLNLNGALILSSGGSPCATPGAAAQAIVAPSNTAGANVVSSSVVTSTSGSTTSSTVVASSSDGSATGMLVSQNSDGTTSVLGGCVLGDAGDGQTLVLGAGLVCLPLPAAAVSSPVAASALVAPSGSACGAPSMTLGPAGISMSSGAC